MVTAIKISDFPLLHRPTPNGGRLAYLDTAASAQKPQAVIDAMTSAMSQTYANIHRGLYDLSQSSTDAFEAARHKIARFINAHDNEVIFTRNATEAINLVAQSWGRQNLGNGDEILITTMEHHANIVPWQMIAEQTGAKLVVAPLNAFHHIDSDAFQKCLTSRTKMVAIPHMSNALGVINPIKEMITAAKSVGALTLIDGCQGIVHCTQDVDMAALGCDFYVFSGHKLYGPTGIGVLFGREDVLNAMPPYQGGGDMIDRVSFEGTTYKQAPARFEAGTPAIVEAIGLGAAIDWLSSLDLHTALAAEHQLWQNLVQRLNDTDGVTIYGLHPDKKNQTGVCSFNIDGIHPSDLAMILNKQNVAIRVGHHCAMPLMDHLGIDGSARVSLGLYSSADDIEQFFTSLDKAITLLR